MPTPKDEHGRWLIGAIAIGLTGLITLLFILFLQEGFRRAIAIPIIQAYYRLWFYLSLLPQYLIWLVPVLVMAAFLFGSYLRAIGSLPREGEGTEKRAEEGDDPLRSLAIAIARARRRPFYRRMVVRELGKTAVRIIAKREGISLAAARERFEDGSWCTDSEVLDLFARARAPAGLNVYEFESKLEKAISVLERLEQGV